MNFLNIKGKKILIFGVANRKSVAFHIGKLLHECGAELIYSVRSPEIKESVQKFLPDQPIYICDVEKEGDIKKLSETIAKDHVNLSGLVHSIAFADYSQGIKPFHETDRKNFLQAMDISCYSLIKIADSFKSILLPEASVVTISISTTRMAAESYGIMGPIKAALDSTICFLAKSFSAFSQIRFNAVGAGLLKTSSSAGIPGYIDCYLFAEQVCLRKKAISTDEVAKAVVFLLSPCSSGINAQTLIVDAGMSINYFDKEIIQKTMRNP